MVHGLAEMEASREFDDLKLRLALGSISRRDFMGRAAALGLLLEWLRAGLGG